MATSWEQIFANIGFGVGALALGLWAVLGVYWLFKATGVLKIVFTWFAFNVVGTLLFRLASQIENYHQDTYPAIDGFRLFFNMSTLLLGLYLAYHSADFVKREKVLKGDHK